MTVETVENIGQQAMIEHGRFLRHIRTCARCRRSYPWCAEGQRLENRADAATNRWEAFR